MSAVAVLLTCYNRKEATLRCLASLAEASLPAAVALTIYLVDDASLDGTGEAVVRQFPEVHLLKGNGSLFWGGGMRLAFGEAMKNDHDFYLWLNDDVDLFPDVFTNLIETYYSKTEHVGEAAIVVGACCEPGTKCTTYGGRVHRGWHPLRFDLVEPDPDQAVPCDTMNGNVVLISRAAAEKVGNLDASFTHKIGDVDYGLRARRAGIKLWVAPGHIGSCKANVAIPAAYRPDHSLVVRLQAVNSPLGRPVGEWLLYGWRHGGVLGAVMSMVGYWRVFFPSRSGLGS